MKLNIGVPKSMKVAAMVQSWEDVLSGNAVGRLMAKADALGFNKCMLGEHFIIPKEHAALSGDWYFHTVVALGYIGGRAEALFGVGWLKEEFDILGVPFAKRGRMADEYVAAMIELWTKDDPEFEGEFVNFRNVGFGPKPIQIPGVPIWFAVNAVAVMKRVAKFGNGWSPFRTPPETFPDRINFM